MRHHDFAQSEREILDRPTSKIGSCFGITLVLWVALFFTSPLFRGSAEAVLPLASWKQIESRSGECKISFPEVPQLIEQNLKVEGTDVLLNYDVYLAPFKQHGVCLLLIAQYPAEVPVGQEMMGLQALVKGIVNRDAENKLVFSEPVLLETVPAINFLVQNGKNYFRAQAIMARDKLFMIAMEGGKAHFDESVFQMFLKSFRLL